MRFLPVLFCLFLLTACDSTRSLKDLREAHPATDPYLTALAQEYREFSEEKLNAYDWWSSRYFADKGLMAAYGRDIGPEDPALWNLDGTEYAEARGRLLAVIETNRTRRPELLATAVVDYDRWLELANNAWDQPHIDGARDMFYATLEELETQPEPQSGAAKKKTRAEEPPLTSVAESTSAILYFPFDTDSLTNSAKAALKEMLSYIHQAGPNVSVNINGHADRVGSDSYNMALSERRAQYVMKTLEDSGVPRKEMQYFAFGESDPKVPTPDNIPEPHNRRVEIFLE